MDLNKTIEQIEGKKWGKPEFQSHVALESHRLRKIPLKELSIENLRLLIGQKFALPITVPLALDVLEENPLAEGDMYKGDLLSNLAKIPFAFWEKHPDFNNRLVEIKNDIEIVYETLSEEIIPSLEKFQFM